MKILIADDYPVARLLLERAVSSIGGCELDFVGTGTEALRAFRNRCHDLVILDQTMPGMSGTEFLRQIADHPARARTRVIMVTGSADSQLIATIRQHQLKVDELLVKPFDIKVLSRKVGLLLAELARERQGSEPVAAPPPPPQTPAPTSVPASAPAPSSFHHAVINQGALAILELVGHFTQDNWPAMNAAAKEVQGLHAHEVLLDFDQVESIDDTGLGLILVLNGLLGMAGRTCSIHFGRFPQTQRLIDTGVTQLLPLRQRPQDPFATDADLKKFAAPSPT